MVAIITSLSIFENVVATDRSEETIRRRASATVTLVYLTKNITAKPVLMVSVVTVLSSLNNAVSTISRAH